SLPFELTGDQVRAIAEIDADLAGGRPMQRLLMGEVGTGKTAVALAAMLRAVENGAQAALMAPTETLAEQHHRTLDSLLGGSLPLELLTGSTTAARRRDLLARLDSGQLALVVGTHALIEPAVEFRDLAVVVVDEQHRFGVEQRSALTGKADPPPHVLVMTATPIPRTVAMTAFGDLDVSVMRELPPGRAEVQTTVVPTTDRPDWLDRAWQRVREEVDKGHQAYLVCARIGSEDDGPGPDGDQEGDQEGGQPLGVLDVAHQLADGPLHGLRVSVLHGRMPPEDKDAVMRGFANGDVDVLVSTTVIEVGVDVPNASVMVVLDADRFGVSQLHQLRGRVRRGNVPGLCLLVTDAPAGTAAQERLQAVASTADGFALSQVDLESRREGDVLGAAQSGRRSSLRLLSVLRDEDVITAARTVADAQVADDPGLERNPALAEAVADLVASQQADYLEKT
ncbi:MAG: ATP-dependent DNA helicase RecG, partial [Nocardioidaceae bacterium]